MLHLHKLGFMQVHLIINGPIKFINLTFSRSTRIVEVKSVDDIPRLNERDPPVAGHHVSDALGRRERSVLPLEDRVLNRLVLTHRTTLKANKR